MKLPQNLLQQMQRRGIVRTPRTWVGIVWGTWWGAGLTPYAPGTMGTLAGIPLAYAACDLTMGAKFALWLLILVTGTWACGVVNTAMGTGDHQNLVVDEVLGMGITALTLTRESGWMWWAVAFGLFRLFDVVKPPPIRNFDRWSKNQAGNFWASGLGVMWDDALAGVYALAVLVALQRWL